MKAMIQYTTRRHELSTLQPESYKIKKIASHQENEMQELFYKLKELVPNCADKNKLSKTELLQNVIDYIFDLEDTLDCTPTCKTPLMESSELNRMDVQECTSDYSDDDLKA